MTIHFNKKIKCCELDELKKNDIIHKCNYCFKKYKTTKIEHENNCHCKKEEKINEEINKKLKKINEEIKELKENKNIKKLDTLDTLDILDKKGYIYLIQLYPYNQCIYKLGQTENFKKRFAQYKSHKPDIVFQYKCRDYKIHEVNLLKLFRSNFNKTDRGSEYFNGDVDKMTFIIIEYFKQFIDIQNISIQI